MQGGTCEFPMDDALPWWVLGGIETHNSPDHVFSSHKMEWPNE